MQSILEDLKKNKFEKVAGDASFRKFYRIKLNNKNYILIYCSKEKKNNLENYAKVNFFLLKNRILAPSLYKIDLKKNYMIIEDFGPKTFFTIINNKKNKLNYYKKIIDCLIQIQSIPFNQSLKRNINKQYNNKILFKESNLFFEWYVPKFILQKKEIKIFKKKINIILLKLFNKLFFQNKFFVHRDFHVSNLMSVKNKIGIIDSQDALIGNPSYDLLSLIDDVRIKTNDKLKKQIYDYYLLKCNKNIKKNKKFFKDDFDILSVQRGLKILGIFSRLYLRDGKKSYLHYIPYMWKLLHNRLKNPLFNELNDVLNHYIPKSKRV